MEATGLGLHGRVRGAVTTALVAHVPPFAIIGVFALGYLLLLDDSHARLEYGIVPILRGLLPMAGIFLGCAAVVGLIVLARMPRDAGGEGRLNRALGWLRSRDWADILLLRLPLAALFFAGSNYFHLTFKINIPNFVPFSWDRFFAGLDRLLFLGHDPWVLTHGLMPDVLASQIFNTFYMLWFLVMQMALFSAAVLPVRHPLRLTFLTAYGLSWLLAGVVLATLFSSVGPVYMERLTGDPTFAPLMERLYVQNETAKILALESQEWLWEGYTLPDVAFYGISAFPSLHLTIAAVCACLGFALNRVMGWLLAGFTFGILLASVHLGWHYAVDGIAGIGLALLFWRIARRLTSWWLARTEPAPAADAGAPAVAAR